MSSTQHTKAHYVLIEPLQTEKYMQLDINTTKGKKREDAEPCQQVAFRVSRWASKTQIRQAIESTFEGVKVNSVRTQNCKGKRRRTRFGYGFTKSWKKAIVKLAPGSSIDLL